MSPWLVVLIFALLFGWLAMGAAEQGYRGGDLMQALRARQMAVSRSGYSWLDWSFAIAAQAGLLWFTFGSKSRFVTDGDKCAVRWMMSGAVLAYLSMGFRYLLKLF
jgi:hypothetical protein